MSYDLMVFEPTAAPRERAEFMDWYAQQTEWKEDHSYDDPNVSSPNLRACFMEMIQQFRDHEATGKPVRRPEL